MEIGGREFDIVQRLYRTKGSSQQTLHTVPYHKTETRRMFYKAESKNETFFVKEYTEKDYGGTLGFPKNIEHEYHTSREYGDYDTTLKLGATTFDITVSPCKGIILGDDKIVFPYLDGYEKLSHWFDNLDGITFDFVCGLAKAAMVWIDDNEVDNYDLCENNTLVNFAGTDIDIKMIDFELSNRHPMEEYRAFIWNQ